MHQECKNCFVFIAEDEVEKLHFFNLCYALWQGRKFHILLIGSVIEFIRIEELSKSLQEASARIKQKQSEYNTILKNIHTLNEHQENLHKQIRLVHELKQAVIQKLFKWRVVQATLFFYVHRTSSP